MAAPRQQELNLLAAQYLSVIVGGVEHKLPFYD